MAPEAVIRTLRVIFSPRCSGNRRLNISRFTPLFDTCLNDAFVEIMSQANEAPVFGQVLCFLLGQDSLEAQRVAFRAIASRKESPEAQEKAAVAATALIGFSTKDDWDELWQSLSQDEAFSKVVVASLANKHTDGGHEFLQRLSERQLEVLGLLKGCATQDAVHELERVATALPEIPWFKIHVLETEGQMLRRSWNPLQPAEILRIARDNNARLVRSAEQLLQVIFESLAHLQDSLQGQTSRSIDLWNEVPVSQKITEYTPKDENRFSDYVKSHLERDIRDRGIVVNREVEIRRGTGGAPGERTDIHVEATAESGDKSFRIIRVIVEAKGAWHKELMTAMRTQLVDRYLRDNECQTGLYLVGWFDCHQWLDTDVRKGKPKGVSLGELRKELATQAQNLSTGGLTIEAHILDASLR
jgi:hypothetical protein